MLFKAMLSSLWGYKKNNKNSNGWLTIESTGYILVKNLFRSDYIGKVGSLTEVIRKKKSLKFKNDLNDSIVLNFRTNSDAESFEIHSSNRGSEENEDSFNKIKKLKELKDLGILSDNEYEQKKQDMLKEI